MYPTFARFAGPADPSVDFSGTWENELGSTMSLEVGARGRVEGRFWTSVGGGGDQEAFELVGFASGDLLSFTVNFGHYKSLTSWVGQHTTDGQGELVQTMWLLARNVIDPIEPQTLWSATLTGSNVFRRRA